MTTVTEDQRMRVAQHIIKTGDELDKVNAIKTSDQRLAAMMAEAMALMVSIDKSADVNRFVDSMIQAREAMPPSIEQWTFLCLMTNWLSWGWHAEEQDELSKAWSDGWYKINDYSLEHLKGDELSYYVKEVD